MRDLLLKRPLVESSAECKSAHLCQPWIQGKGAAGNTISAWMDLCQPVPDFLILVDFSAVCTLGSIPFCYELNYATLFHLVDCELFCYQLYNSLLRTEQLTAMAWL